MGPLYFLRCRAVCEVGRSTLAGLETEFYVKCLLTLAMRRAEVMLM